MPAKPSIAIVGAGKLGTALALSLHQAGFPISAILVRKPYGTKGNARKLARRVRSRLVTDPGALSNADLIWFCVPDSEIFKAAARVADKLESKPIASFHSSGALTSRELNALRKRGAAVASVHPLMTFVRGSQPSLGNVPFAIEGDAAALRIARRIINDVGGQSFSVRPSQKATYHAWGTFASPLFTALLATTERVAQAAGLKPKEARERMIPILLQTLANYASFGGAGAFSGPLVRGDVGTVERHMQVLKRHPLERKVYGALAQAALRYLPTRNQAALRKLLGSA